MSILYVHSLTLVYRLQIYLVPQELWNKITESMAGYLLTDSATRVPTLDRELYDELNQTETRYGIGEGQTMIGKQEAIDIILSDLLNPENDFYPIDMDAFFETYSFDTSEDIVDMMAALYISFSHVHVNRIFFAILHTALSKKQKYPDLFKTSMVSLHGIKILEVGGLFDD